MSIIYLHRNKINGKVYIGQTSQQPEVRWRNGFGYIGSPYFYAAIQKYGWDNFEHIILFEDLTLEEANQKEIELIAQYDSTNRTKGYNIMQGGKQSPLSEETKKKLSISHKGIFYTFSPEKQKEIGQKISQANMGENNGFYGKKHTEETKQKMRENHQDFSGEKHPCYGRKCSQEERKRMSRQRKGTHLYADNPNAKSVDQFDLQMNYIQTFSTIKQAAEFIGVKSTSNISSCCRCRIKHCGGYIWRYTKVGD